MVIAAVAMPGAGGLIAAAQARGGDAVPETFVARNIRVDVRAGSVTEARAQAIRQGYAAGVMQVFRRLVPSDYHSALPQLSETDLAETVADYSISDERSSAVRYIADMTVRTRPDRIRLALRSAGIPFAETVSKPVAVLPVYQRSVVDTPVLWGDDNPWYALWAARRAGTSLLPMTVPLGDLQDMTTVDVYGAMAAEPDAVAELAERYGTGRVIVAHAVITGTALRPALQVRLTGVDPELPAAEVILTFAGEEGQSTADLLQTAMAQTAERLTDGWKQENLIRFDLAATVPVLIPVTGLADWLDIKARLSALPLVERLDEAALSRDRVQANLRIVGDAGQLSLAMAQQDLRLIADGEIWLIERTSAPTP